MTRLRTVMSSLRIDPEAYCAAPAGFYEFEVSFLPRTRPDDRADPALGEDMGVGAFLIATASAIQQPHDARSLTSNTASAAFCKLPIDLEMAVLFVNHTIETRL